MIHTDHLGTPHKMTDANQAVVWSAYYKPFGAATVTVSTVTNNLRFPGQYFDQETGLHYNYARDYNPVLDRYIEADPIGLRGGLNLYLYVSANSLRFTDRRGLLLGGNATIGNPPGLPGTTIGPPPGPVIGPQPPPPPGSTVPKCWKFNQAKYSACLAEHSVDLTTLTDIGQCFGGNKEACYTAAGTLYLNLFGCYTESFDEVPRNKCGQCPE